MYSNTGFLGSRALWLIDHFGILAIWYTGMMAYEILYWPAADDALIALEGDPVMRSVRQAVGRVERALAEDPFSRTLGTISFVTDELGGINATPVGADDWYVIWQRASVAGTIDIIQVHQLRR